MDRRVDGRMCKQPRGLFSSPSPRPHTQSFLNPLYAAGGLANPELAPNAGDPVLLSAYAFNISSGDEKLASDCIGINACVGLDTVCVGNAEVGDAKDAKASVGDVTVGIVACMAGGEAGSW